MADEQAKPQTIEDPNHTPETNPRAKADAPASDKPEQGKPAADLKPVNDAGEGIMNDMGDKVVQNDRDTLSEHPGLPGLMSHIHVDACDKQEFPAGYGETDQLLNVIAKHIMNTDNDVVLHEQIKEHLKARGVEVSGD